MVIGLVGRGRWCRNILRGLRATTRPSREAVMWRRPLDLPGLHTRMSTRIAALHAPDRERRDVTDAERVQELE